MFNPATDPQPAALAAQPARQAIADTVLQLLQLAGEQDEALLCMEKASFLARAWGGSANAEAAGPRKGGLAPWQLRRIRQFIEDHLTATIRIKDLAKSVRLSDSYFFQAFRKTFGQSPHAYVIERRIEQAQKMMILTSQPLSQIALECGLADQPHLTRLFRRHVGTSPASWRKVHRGPHLHGILQDPLRAGRQRGGRMPPQPDGAI